MLGGTRLTAATRWPPTASVRLRRSVVVVTTGMRSCANAGDASARNAPMSAPRNTLMAASALDPDALRHQAMDVLLAVGHRADAAVHRHAGETVSVEPG